MATADTIETTDQTGDLPTGLSGLTEHGIVLEGVSWETYEKLLAGIGDRRIFVTYDRGTMEIEMMSPAKKHERSIGILIALVNSLRFLKNIPIETGGSTTEKRKDLAKGVEPDASYWIANEKIMRGVDELDLSKHPAPDLIIEVDNTSSSIDKIGIYRHLGVPEIWHVTEAGLQFLILENDTYHQADTSSSFSFIDRKPVERALKIAKSLGESAALDQLLTDLKLR